MIRRKYDFPLAEVRRFIEPGPVVLVSSAHDGARNVMTMGWHMMMEFVPARIGCVISDANHSFEMIRRSGECVINVPEVDMAETVVGIGNSSGRDIDKFATFGLTAAAAETVDAPLVADCFVNLECRVADTSLLRRFGLFIFEVTKAHAPRRPKNPRTLHYRGEGIFMRSGDSIDLSRGFLPERL